MELKDGVVFVIKEIMLLRDESDKVEEINLSSIAARISLFLVLAVGVLFIVVGYLSQPDSWWLQPGYKQIFWVVFLFLTLLAAVDTKRSGIGSFIKDPTSNVLEAMGDNLASYAVMFQKLDTFRQSPLRMLEMSYLGVAKLVIQLRVC